MNEPEPKPKKDRKSYLKWVVALLVIVLLIAGIRMSLKSDWLLDYARGIVVEQANQQLNGEVQIGAIRGDLLFGFTISDITISDLEQNEILAIDTLRLRYTLPSLIRTPHRLDLLRADGLRGTLVQDQDSVWNAERLLPETDPDEEPEDSDPLYWSVDRLVVDRADISVRSDLLLPDGYLEIQDLAIETHAEMFPDRWLVSLDHLSLKLIEGRLPAPVELSMQAVAMEEQITLESLVLNTGRSMLSSSAEFTNQQNISGNVDLTPLSRLDVAAYLEEYPVRKDLKIGVTAEGTIDNLTLSVNVDANEGGHFSVSATSDISDPFILKDFSFEANRFNGPELLGDPAFPSFQYASLNGSGEVNLAEPELANWEGDFILESFSLDEYGLDRAAFRYTVSDQTAELNGSLRNGGEEIAISAGGSSLFDEQPEWRITANGDRLYLATWLRDPELDSRLNLSLEATGSGVSPEDLTSTFSVRVSDGRFGEQEFATLNFSGNIDPNELNGDLLAALDKSQITSSFSIRNWADDPNYVFALGIEEFNLAELSGLEELPTYLNGTLRGEGRSFDLETLQVSATALFDSSIVNGAPIDTLRADINIENQTIYIEDAILESSIADADFTLRQHFTDLTHPQNRLQFSARVKDLFPVAALVGVEQLLAEGEINGSLEQNSDGISEFTGFFDFENIAVDTLFTANRISGNTSVLLLDDIEVMVNIDIANPEVMDQGVQDFNMNATVKITDDETSGDVNFELINDGESRLVHAGSFSITPDRSLLTTNKIDFITPEGFLSLKENFDVTFADDVLRVDTLRIQTEDEESYVELWAPHVDSLSQNIGLDARALNLGVLQRTLIGEEFVDGFLSGYIQLNNSPDSLTFSANGLLTEFQFENGQMDSLIFSTNIENEWLDVSFSGSHNNEELFSSNARVPFLPGDPVTFDDQFFDREIDGQFVLNRTDVDYWLSFMPGDPVEQTDGFLSFNGKLGGQAGNPEFIGDLKFNQGNLSGVPVDSIGINIQYDHETEELGFRGDVTSRNTRVLEFNSRVPFKIDLREIEVLLPSDDDSLTLDLETQNFNLAIFNDFVDRDVIRQIEGRLNGSINVSGTLANLEPRGNLELSNGSIRVMMAGITISNIGSRVSFSPDQIELQQFSMQSGPGRIRASGNIAIENLQPGDMNIEIRGNQFRAINTPEYNAIVDLTSNITGTFEEPNLRGSLTFLSGFVNLQNFGERAVEEVILEGEEEAEPFDFYEAMEIEMDVAFTRQFFIRNRQFLDLEIELGGQVDLLKRRNDDLEMFGQLEGVRGFARPLGRNFEIEDAFVTFYGPVDNPELNVRTQFVPPQARADVTIYYIIEGTAQDPEFRFESEPQMELQDIFSYTVFGRPFYELESWEQVVAGSGGGGGPADVALDVLLDRVELLASQRLGIDVVQIDNSRTGSNSSTSILTGWYLNRRTFFALINEISATPKTLFLLEYLLTENLELIITQGDDSREGVDLRWKYDY